MYNNAVTLQVISALSRQILSSHFDASYSTSIKTYFIIQLM